MAVIETWLNQDLQKPVKVQYIDGSLFSNNANGNRIGVVVTDNGEPVTISGTVSGYVVVSDGSTVPCTGAKSGNRASILIPPAAYVPGSAFISLFITDGTTVTTLAAVSTTVLQTRTGTQVDPGSVVTDWTQTINGAMQDVQTAAANLGGIVATPYASLTYPVPLGKYTYYDGGLYRCISPIASSETFTPAHWTAVKLGDDVSDLKTAFNSADANDVGLSSGKNMFDKNDPSIILESAIMTGDTIISNSYTTGNFVSQFIRVKPETQYTWSHYSIGSTMGLSMYNRYKQYIGFIQAGGADGITAKNGLFTTPANIYFIRLTGITENIATAVLAEGNYVGGAYVAYTPVNPIDILQGNIDDLSDDTIHLVSGKNKFNKNDPNVVSGACIISDGSVLQNSYTTNYYATGYIPVNPITRYLWTDYNIGSTMALAFYNSEKTCIGYIPGGGADGLVATNGKFTTIANTAYIRITGTTANINSAMLVVGTIAGDYEPFQKVNPINDNLINGNHVKVVPIFRVKSADLSSNLTMAVPNLKQKIFTFTANCTTVGTLTIANGLRLAYKSGWIMITSTKLIVRSYRYTGSGTGEMTELEVTHNLDLTGFISVTLKHNANKTAEVILCGKNGKVFRTGFYFEGCADDLTVYNYQGTYSNCTLTMWCEHFKKDVWAFGDSYFDMWPLKAIPMGATNVMFDAYTGRNSAQALTSLSLDFEKCLPKKVLWCMGMNDPDADSTVNASWKSAFDSVKALCNNYGIEFIGCTIPNTPTMENSYKNAYVKSSGVRYVDVAEAVGASESGSSWYAGLLSTDNVHPTDLGREIIAGAVIAGVPEIMTDEVVTST